MIEDFLRNVVHRLRAGDSGDSRRGNHAASGARRDLEGLIRRKSNGLNHFLTIFPRDAGMKVLDLGGVSESNVAFLSELGCKIYLDNLLANFDRTKSALPNRRFEPAAAAAFVEENLRYPAEQFDAILVWDILEFLDRELLTALVPRLFDILKPGGGLLAFFHTQTRGEAVEIYRYQIEGPDTLLLRTHQNRPLPATFNNRSIERLFSEFDSLKFFLTRDHLREVIAIR